ncbi:PREDICTED: myosin heavy chain, clone 203-like [Nicotiana attenuata]|uniref:myosin heavy chain, clone 203-like n=1 Tax=Nicotiana attenuata TaxID=49451 RepID=UPI000904705C|nr:PREDICTED: myosin heavy chain, clone 203-like [Nicotiana attenuata]
MTSKYAEYRTKHQTLADFLNQDGEFQSLRDGLKQKDDELMKKDEELRERGDELMRAIGRCNELEATLKAKEDELEVSKGVMAENTDLQMQVASLTAKLGQREEKAVDLRGELSAKVEELNRAEKGRMAAMAEVAALEDALRVCRSERDNEVETSALKVARLEERMQGLEAELSGLNEQAVVLKDEEVRRQSQSSKSHTSANPGVPRELYEMWVHAEAQLDVYKSLKAIGKISEKELEGVRVKARAACEAYGYAPGTPGGDEVDNDADRLASNSWYDDEYADGGDVA